MNNVKINSVNVVSESLNQNPKNNLMQKKKEDITSKKDKTILEKEIDQVVDYLKQINEEVNISKDHHIKNTQHNYQQSFNSITQKSLLVKAEENKASNKINFQTLFALEDKENMNDYPMRILKDNLNKEPQTREGKIHLLLTQMENYKDVVLESFLCKTNEDRLILDLYLTISRESFTLYSEQDKRMKNYFKTLKEVNFPCDINENLTNINNQYLFIEDISTQTEDLTSKNICDNISDNDEANDYDYDFEYENDDESIDLYEYDNIEEKEKKGHTSYKDNNNNKSAKSDSNNSDGNIDNDSDDICELEEVNVEIKNKLILNEDTKKDIKLKIQPNDSLFIPNDLKYTRNKKHIEKLRQIGFDNIITIIHTDKHLLPFGLSNISMEELMLYIANIENSKLEKDLYVLINGTNNRSIDGIKTYTEGEDYQKRQNAMCCKYFKSRFIQASGLEFEEKFNIHEELNKSEFNNNRLNRYKAKNKHNLQTELNI